MTFLTDKGGAGNPLVGANSVPSDRAAKNLTDAAVRLGENAGVDAGEPDEGDRRMVGQVQDRIAVCDLRRGDDPGVGGGAFAGEA
jgi:hypothetical protein